MIKDQSYLDWLFKKHQKALLTILNTREGRLLQGISSEYDKLPIVQVSANHVSFLKGKNLVGIFYAGSRVARIWGEALEKAIRAAKGVDIHALANYSGLGQDSYYPRIFLTTTDYVPDADPEVSTVDGNVQRTGVDEVWSSIRSGSGNGKDDTATNGDTTTHVYLQANGTSGHYSDLYRGIYLFDTSAIPDTNTISSATFKMYITANGAALGSSGVGMVIPTTSSNTALANGDFDIGGWTMVRQASDLAFASMSNNAYNTWTLNATGLSNISKTGITKFGLALDLDIDNTTPTWASSGAAFINGHFAERANDPTLTVTYSAATSGGSFLFNLM